MNNSLPYLQKYTGRSSRHECPACHDPHSFALYLDGDTGQVIHKSVGRCNHESSCGYHYSPKEYFTDNPVEREKREFTPHQYRPKQQPKEIGTIPFSCVEKSASYKSDFIYFLCSLFDTHSLNSPTIERLMSDYALGATKDRDIIYWQIDTEGRVRTGKVMKYNPENREEGKRCWRCKLGSCPDEKERTASRGLQSCTMFVWRTPH